MLVSNKNNDYALAAKSCILTRLGMDFKVSSFSCFAMIVEFLFYAYLSLNFTRYLPKPEPEP